MAQFETFYPLLAELEGGYQAIESDSGNYNSLNELVGTNYGISARFYEDYIGYPPSEEDMKDITKQEAKKIYREEFWDYNYASEIENQDVANTVIDMEINSGNGVRMAQEVLKNQFEKDIAIDGIMGNETLGAINNVNPIAFVNEYNFARIEYYMSLGKGEWLSIWVRRVQKFAISNSNTLGQIFFLLVVVTGFVIYKNM